MVQLYFTLSGTSQMESLNLLMNEYEYEKTNCDPLTKGAAEKRTSNIKSLIKMKNSTKGQSCSFVLPKILHFVIMYVILVAQHT